MGERNGTRWEEVQIKSRESCRGPCLVRQLFTPYLLTKLPIPNFCSRDSHLDNTQTLVSSVKVKHGRHSGSTILPPESSVFWDDDTLKPGVSEPDIYPYYYKDDISQRPPVYSFVSIICIWSPQNWWGKPMSYNFVWGVFLFLPPDHRFFLY